MKSSAFTLWTKPAPSKTWESASHRDSFCIMDSHFEVAAFFSLWHGGGALSLAAGVPGAALGYTMGRRAA